MALSVDDAPEAVLGWALRSQTKEGSQWRANRCSGATRTGHGDETTVLLSFLDEYRDAMVSKIQGLDKEQARWVPTEQASSLLTLIVHLTQVEEGWIIHAPTAVVFAVLADPTKHAAIDGTGWVSDSLDSESLTAAGQVFRIAMYHPNHPDGNYQMANRVQVFDPPNAISWEPGYDTKDGQPGLRRLGVALRPDAGWTV